MPGTKVALSVPATGACCCAKVTPVLSFLPAALAGSVLLFLVFFGFVVYQQTVCRGDFNWVLIFFTHRIRVGQARNERAISLLVIRSADERHDQGCILCNAFPSFLIAPLDTIIVSLRDEFIVFGVGGAATVVLNRVGPCPELLKKLLVYSLTRKLLAVNETPARLKRRQQWVLLPIKHLHDQFDLLQQPKTVISIGPSGLALL